MSRKKPKVGLNPVKLMQVLTILIIICTILIGIGYLAGAGLGKDEAEEISAVVVEEQIAAISELATVSYNYTDLGQYESSKEFYGTKVPFTTNKFILTYDGIIKAGINMDGVQVKVEGQNVIIVLPKATILSHEIDETSMQVFDEQTSLFNPFTVEDYASFYADQKSRIEQKAIDKGLLAEAQDHGEITVRGMIEPLLPEGWTLEII